MAVDKTTYAMNVKVNDENEIHQLSYSTRWIDISLMLTLKYECEEGTWFTYTDGNEDKTVIKNQEDFNEALKVCKVNSDVLRLQMWSPKVSENDVFPADEARFTESPNSQSSSKYLYVAGKAAIDGTYKLASNVVKTAINGFNQSTGGPHSSSSDRQEVAEDVELVTIKTDEETSQEQKRSQSSCGDDDRDDFEKEPQTVSQTSLQTSIDANKGQDETMKTLANSEIVDSKYFERIKNEVQFAVKLEFQAIKQELSELLTSAQLKNIDPKNGSGENAVRTVDMIKQDLKTLTRELEDAEEMQQNEKSPNNVVLPTNRFIKECFRVEVVCESLCAGSPVEQNGTFVKYWVLKNVGEKDWSRDIRFMMVDETPQCTRVDVGPWGADLYNCRVSPLKRGDVTVVSMTHVAPPYNCNYKTTWSFCLAGRVFGPKFYCDVQVFDKESWPEEEEEDTFDSKFTGFDKHYMAHDEINQCYASSFKLNDEPADEPSSSVVELFSVLSENDNSSSKSNANEDNVNANIKKNSIIISQPGSINKKDDAVDDGGSSSDFEVIPLPSSFDLNKSFKSLEDVSLTAAVSTTVEKAISREDLVNSTVTASGSSLVEVTCPTSLNQLTTVDTAASASTTSTTTSINDVSIISDVSVVVCVDDKQPPTQQQTASSSSSNSTSLTKQRFVKVRNTKGIKQQPLPVPQSVLDCDKAFKSKSKRPIETPVVAAAMVSNNANERFSQESVGRPVHGGEVAVAAPKAPGGAAAATLIDKSTPSAKRVKIKSPKKSDSPQLTGKLQQLTEMGFADRQLNIHLLREFNGDVTGVVNALVNNSMTTTTASDGERQDDNSMSRFVPGSFTA